MTRISVRVDENLRREAESILNDLEMNMSTAVNIFLRQLVIHEGLPFTPVRRKKEIQSIPNSNSAEELLRLASTVPRLEKGYTFVRSDLYDRHE